MVTDKSVGELEAKTERLLRRAGDVTTELRSHTDELATLLVELREMLRDSGMSQEGDRDA
jgi:hypothetical protein